MSKRTRTNGDEWDKEQSPQKSSIGTRNSRLGFKGDQDRDPGILIHSA